MTDVFISYSRADKERVAELARAIEAEGYDVWWDEELPPHMSYGDVITDKIENAKAAVVVWSADASKSEWVRAEADAARNHKKLIQTALADIIPPLPFNQIQCADLSDWHGEEDHPGWRKVKQSLVALCGAREAKAAAEPVVAAPPPPAPPPPPPPPPPEPEPVAPAPATPPPVSPPPAAPPADDKAKSKKGALIGGGIIAGLVLVPALFMAVSSGNGENPDSQPAVTTYDIDEPVGGEDTLIGSEDALPPPPPIATQAAPAQQAAPAADAYNRDVVLINQSGEVVMYMYWSNTDQENWGPDQLGDDVWPDGQSASVTIDDGSGACQFDFMAVTASGREIVRPDVNVCGVYEIYFN